MLRSDAPQIRTAEKVIEKFEQIQDGLERQALTPKTAEQMNQTLKGIMGVERLAMQYWSLARKFGKSAPIPRTPITRSLLGLRPDADPSDGANVRKMLAAD